MKILLQLHVNYKLNSQPETLYVWKQEWCLQNYITLGINNKKKQIIINVVFKGHVN